MSRARNAAAFGSSAGRNFGAASAGGGAAAASSSSSSSPSASAAAGELGSEDVALTQQQKDFIECLKGYPAPVDDQKRAEIDVGSQRCEHEQCQELTPGVGFYCAQHLKELQRLEIKQSGVSKEAGRGLFATGEFKKRARIAEYTGDILSLEQEEARKSHYTAQVEKLERYLDAARTNTDVGRMANTPGKSGPPANAKIVVSTYGKPSDKNAKYVSAHLTATRNIRAGEEILVRYGFDPVTAHAPMQDNGEDEEGEEEEYPR